MADDTLIEERPETMISPTSKGEKSQRIARFLKPTAKTAAEAAAIPFRFLSTEPISRKLLKFPYKIEFKGWRRPQKKWKEWVSLMLPKYSSIWKKSGIYNAIMTSICEIRRDPSTILGLIEFWCEETNTFAFEWGEATVTLQDMLVLGGFSVLGESVNGPLTEELKEMERKMVIEHRGFSKHKAKKASHSDWLNHYMGSESEFEHVAFLCLLVSRHVLPAYPFNTIGQYVFSIAIRLAQGTQIAIGPAVLASIYRDMSLIKRNIDNKVLASVVWAPFQLLQIWIWERFIPLRPKSSPNSFYNVEPRAAQWEKLSSSLKLEFVRKVLKSSKEFQWRPYALNVEMGVWIDAGEDEELQSLARCLRVSELVGLDCLELYHPHRVAMQFGFDQDLPGHVSLTSLQNCRDPDEETRLFVPGRVFECDVSLRYLEWWKRTVSDRRAAIEGVLEQLMSSKKGDEREENAVVGSVPPGFTPKTMKRNLQEVWDDDDLTLLERLKLKKQRIRPSSQSLPVGIQDKKGSMAEVNEEKRKESEECLIS